MTRVSSLVHVNGGRRLEGVRRELIAATGLLTRVAVEARGDRTGAAVFGIIGAAIGGLGAAILLLTDSIAPEAGPILPVIAVAVASGGLHLDGLADTADALAAASPEAAERARRDPRAGPAGIVAVVAALALDWALVAELNDRDPVGAALGIVTAITVSRAVAGTAPVLARRSFRPGFGAWFADRVTPAEAVCAAATSLLVAVALALGTGRTALLPVTITGLVAGVGLVFLIERLRRGLDGDALGAVVELTAAATLLAAVAWT